MKIIYIIICYLFGSIPSGYILFKLVEGKDIRTLGSGNIGFANVTRLKGLSLGIPVLIFDFMKGFFSVWIGIKIFNDLKLAAIGGLFACVGHIFPSYLKFKGGKGFATALGVFTALFFLGALIVSVLAILIIITTGYVSVASLTGVILYPIILLIWRKPISIVLVISVITILVILRHRENIRRLTKGEERKLKRRHE